MKLFFYTIVYFFIFLILESTFKLFSLHRQRLFGFGNLLNFSWILLISSTFFWLIINFILRKKETAISEKFITKNSPNSEELKEYFNSVASYRKEWKKRNQFYYQELNRVLNFLIPEHSSLLEIGCGTGDTLFDLGRANSTGIDFSSGMLDIARKNYPLIKFHEIDIELPEKKKLGKFKYLLMSDLLGNVTDVQKSIMNSLEFMEDDSRLVITFYNFLWEPVLKLLEKLKLKMPQYRQNWLSMHDMENFLELSGLETIKKGTGLILPIYIPFLSSFLNRYLIRLPIFKHLGLFNYIVARKSQLAKKNYSLSIVIPARNEAGNIEDAILRMPQFATKKVEIIFVEGNSTDHTWKEMQRVQKKYNNRIIRKDNSFDIKIMQQPGKGKGDAVRTGFRAATGDIVTILDADLTMPPEELPKYYNVIAERKADFVNGCRLIYPMEDEAMRFFNVIGNKFFSLAFTWLLDQPLKDTLCGTKMLSREHYENIVINRSYFGEFDPFGDFDLLFGAAKMNLKILEMPIHYKNRLYGETNIQRWKHGMILLRMVIFASRKIKFF